jgi:Lrp/AsnC family leucine-responsive transcriptional regulator
MKEIYRLDRLDVSILAALQRNSRMTWLELGEAAGLSATSAQRRVRSLQQAGVIRSFTVELDRHRLGQEVHAFVSVNVDQRDAKLAERFRVRIAAYPEVQACYKLSGTVDFLLDVVAPDIGSYGRFLDECILTLDGVKDASSAIVLDTVKEPKAMIPRV